MPVGLLLGFCLLAWVLFGDRLLARTTVETGSVLALRTDDPGLSPTAEATDPREGKVLFQASGWIEADPFPLRATALTDGVIDEVHVLEGETVADGQILATLIDEDARIALAAAQARVDEASAVLRGARRRAVAAESQARVAEAQIEAAKARLEELRDDAQRLERVGARAVSAGEIRRASLRVDSQKAVLAAREAEAAASRAEADAVQESVARAEAALATARAERDEHQLALDRTRISSPTDGVIQRLLAEPGQKKMLRMDDPESATVAILFRPDSLQARIDVPLESAAGLAVGQPVRVHTNFLPDTVFPATVNRIVGEADLQRNTLQAKVSLLETDPRLRPEMLCRAEFLAAAVQADGAPGGYSRPGGTVVFVPAHALFDREEDRASVWAVDPLEARLERRTVRIGPSQRDGYLEVAEGVNPGEKVVLDPDPGLTAGQRVRINEEP